MVPYSDRVMILIYHINQDTSESGRGCYDYVRIIGVVFLQSEDRLLIHFPFSVAWRGVG